VFGVFCLGKVKPAFYFFLERKNKNKSEFEAAELIALTKYWANRIKLHALCRSHGIRLCDAFSPERFVVPCRPVNLFRLART
jgi:hypothetical protein